MSGDPAGGAARMRAASGYYHRGASAEAVRGAWGAQEALPWKWQLERTLEDPLMGAPLRWGPGW